MSTCQVLIAGARGGTNIGESMFEGARPLGIAAQLVDARQLSQGSRLWSKLLWHAFDHRPPGLWSFSRALLRETRAHQPEAFLALGFGLVKHDTVQAIGAQGVRTLAFLTDDPWAKGQRSRWSMRALPHYDVIVTPRRANIDDLRQLGCRDVRYLPFGYDPRLFYPEPPDPALSSDVIFVGGAERERVPWIAALLRAGFRVALYGSYWDRFWPTRHRSRGQAGPEIIRRATSSAKVALCLVRRANRDGHVMRSLEIPAIGTCMLTEDTDEHRALFGADGECVVYFRTRDDMIERLSWLLAHDAERERLARAARERVVSQGNTYGRRLEQLLAMTLGQRGSS